MRAELRVDHFVTTADGTLCKVTYGPVLCDDVAVVEVRTVEGDTRLTLPVGELKRVADPSRKRPAIEGVPAERPRCAWCGRLLRPDVTNHYSDGPLWQRVITRRTFDGWHGYPRHAPIFDTTLCTMAFGVASHKAGYRRKGAA